MKWQVELRPAAIADLDDAAVWYDERSAGLGREFVREVVAAISSLQSAPQRARLRHRTAGIRWIYPRRFPYQVIYRTEGTRVVVLAILHASRSDAAWRDRR
jgi:toxin ParE1/3/4